MTLRPGSLTLKSAMPALAQRTFALRLPKAVAAGFFTSVFWLPVQVRFFDLLS